MSASSLRERMNTPGGPQHAILAPGNHDECFDMMPGALRDLFDANVHILYDESIVLEGMCIYGSPWTPPFMNRYFMADEVRLGALYENTPASVDMFITHGTPFGILDPGWNVAHAGSTSLADAMAKRSIRDHVFGHLHAAGGQSVQ